MTFVSPIFLVFAAIVVSVNYFLKGNTRLLWQLLASLVFIAFFNIESCVAVVVLGIANYYLGKKIAENASSKAYYYIGLTLNISAILIFNYFTSIGGKLGFKLSVINFNIESLVLALGLSFYSLQNIAYLYDVCKKNIQVEKSVLNYLLSVSFFPKITSGPVTLAQDILPQFKNSEISQQQIIQGFQRFVLGLFKKMVIADRLAPSVHSIFDYGDDYSGIIVITAAFLFTIQLYFDFSGYTDMTLGIAKMLGYELKENFNFPLRSRSISDFWRRWHISLISFFTNYIFYPLAFKLRKHKRVAAYTGIITTFILSAIWHGIGLTFLCWGLCHIVYLCFELSTKKIRSTLSEKISVFIYAPLSILITLIAVSFSNIFFRAGSFHTATQLIKNGFTNFLPTDWAAEYLAPLAVGGQQLEEFNFYSTLLFAFLFLLFEKKIMRVVTTQKINVIYLFVALILILVFGVFASGERFIYMQF